MKLTKEFAIDRKRIAYMDDDLPDVPALVHAGYSFTVPESPEEVRSRVLVADEPTLPILGVTLHRVDPGVGHVRLHFTREEGLDALGEWHALGIATDGRGLVALGQSGEDCFDQRGGQPDFRFFAAVRNRSGTLLLRLRESLEGLVCFEACEALRGCLKVELRVTIGTPPL